MSSPRPDHPPLDPRRLVFLISQPRSGSTMLRLMLNRHPAVLCPAEPWIALPFCSFATGLQNSALFPSRDGPAALDEFFLNSAYGTTLNFARDCLLRAYGSLPDSGQKLVVDKTPPYHRIAPWLEAVFPEARFIILKRHPLAVIHSFATRWFNQRVDEAIHERYDDLVLAPGRLAALKPDAKRRHILAYEDLVRSPEAELRRLCEFLGVPPSPGMVNYLDDKPPAPAGAPGFGDQFSTLEHRAPNPQLTDQWQRSPLRDDLLQAAQVYFPPRYWETAGYARPDSPRATALAREPVEELDLTLAENFGRYHYGEREATPPAAPGAMLDFIPTDDRDHAASRFIALHEKMRKHRHVLVSFRGTASVPAAAGARPRLIVQDQTTQTLMQFPWPLSVEGLSLPLRLPEHAEAIRFVFMGRKGHPIPLPQSLLIQCI